MSSTYMVKDKNGTIVAANVTKKTMLETVRKQLKNGKMKYRGISRLDVPKKSDFSKMFDASRVTKGKVIKMTADQFSKEPMVKLQHKNKTQKNAKVTVAKKGLHTIDENSTAMNDLVAQVLATDTPDVFDNLLKTSDGVRIPAHAKDLSEWQNDTTFLDNLVEDAEQHIDNILTDELDFSDAVLHTEKDDNLMDSASSDDGTPVITEDKSTEPTSTDNGDDEHDIFDDIAELRKKIEEQLNTGGSDDSDDLDDEGNEVNAETVVLEPENEDNNKDIVEDVLISTDAIRSEEIDNALTPFTISDEFGDIFSFDKDKAIGTAASGDGDSLKKKNDLIDSAKTLVSNVKLDIDEKVEELQNVNEDGTPFIVEKLDTLTDVAGAKINESVESIKEKFEYVTEKLPDAVSEENDDSEFSEMNGKLVDDDFNGGENEKEDAVYVEFEPQDAHSECEDADDGTLDNDDNNGAECDEKKVGEKIIEEDNRSLSTGTGELTYRVGDLIADTDGHFLGTVIGIGDGVVFLPVGSDNNKSLATENNERIVRIVSINDITMYEDSMDNILGDIETGNFNVEALTTRFRELIRAKQH